MSWIGDFRRDLGRYVEYGGRPVVQLLTQQGLWALFQYRAAHAVYRSALPGWIRRPLLVLAVVWQKAVEILTGISLPYSAELGPGLYIGHFGPVIVNGAAVVGEGCNLSQGVTLGVSGRGDRRGVPVIGNRVYIGAQATVAGRIRVGDDVVIGANSLVTEDVPPHVTVVGVPATIVSGAGSADYLSPGGAA